MAPFRVLQRGLPSALSASESDGENVGRGDAADKGGAAAGSVDVLPTVTGNEICLSGPIRITEPGETNKVPDIGEAAEASGGQEATEEVHNRNQEQSESVSRLPQRLPSTSPNRRKRRATTRVAGSDTQQETKRRRRARAPNWTSEETQMLRAWKSQLCHLKGKQCWEAIALEIGTRDADQCRQRWDTLQRGDNKTPTTTTTSGPAANELNGASTSTRPVGKPDVPSIACPNPEVSRPAGFPVEQGPAAFEGWREYEEAGISIDSYLVLTKTKKHQSCEEAKQMLLNIWWLHLSSGWTRAEGSVAAAGVEGRFPCMGQQCGLAFCKPEKTIFPTLMQTGWQCWKVYYSEAGGTSSRAKMHEPVKLLRSKMGDPQVENLQERTKPERERDPRGPDGDGGFCP